MSGSTSAGVVRVDATADIGELESNLRRAAELVNGYVAQSNRAAAATQAQSAANDNVSRSTERLGQVMGQAGFQVQDFAGQVAAGQNALVAFAQQGSQLLGIFGTGGAIAGAVLTVGVLAAQLLTIGDNAEDAKKSAEAAFQGMTTYAEQTTKVVSDVADMFTKVEDRAKRAAAAQIESARATTLTQLSYATQLQDDAATQVLQRQQEVARLEQQIARTQAILDRQRRSGAMMPVDQTGLEELQSQLFIARAAISGNQNFAGRQSERIAQLNEALAKLDAPNALQQVLEAGERPSRAGGGATSRAVPEVGPGVSDFLRSQDQIAAALEKTRNALDPTARATAEYEETLRTLNTAADAGILGQEEFSRLLEQAQSRLNGVAANTRNAVDIGREFGTVFTSAFDGIVSGSTSATEALEKLGLGIAKIIERTFITKPLEQGLNNLFNQAQPGLNSFFGDLFGGLFGGGRADGGPVDSNRWYVVGEEGPEIFAPGVSGQVIPNGALGGDGGNVSIAIDARGAEQGVEARINAGIARALPAIIAATKGDLARDVNRGGAAAVTFGRRAQI